MFFVIPSRMPTLLVRIFSMIAPGCALIGMLAEVDLRIIFINREITGLQNIKYRNNKGIVLVRID